ncbi:MAG: hypothetical protein R2867_35375 [Caldilineaceae bacterium]
MITRIDFEEWMSLSMAREVVDSFFGDRSTYPDFEFYSRKRGINKDIPEEYYPLLLLGESLPYVERIRLSPDSLPGPDGALLLDDGSMLSVQVTLSYERDDGYAIRKSLRDTGWYTKGVACDTANVITQRTQRILAAVEDKEAKFRPGTDILLVVDKSISWGDVIDTTLPNSLNKAFKALPVSKYSATYVIFGVDVRRVR